MAFPNNPPAAAVAFDPAYFASRYPEFAAIAATTAPGYFIEAGLYLNNTGTSVVTDPNMQYILLHQLTAHLAELFDATSQRGSAPLVGRITDIKPTKRPGRYSVFVDGAFAFALEDIELSGSGLAPGVELSVDELEKWQGEAERSKLRARTLGYLAIRKRSRWEIGQYLKRHGYNQEEVEYAIDYAANLGYLDDLAFARAWIEYRQSTSPRSQLKLAAELRAKGLDRDVIDEALAGQDKEAQMEALQRLITKKRRLYADDQKLIDYCLRQGFPINLIKSLLSENN